MTENEKINGWTFEETVKTAENLMEAENNMFKWDVLRHLRDFAENYKEELEQYRAIETVEKCRVAVERMKPKKPFFNGANYECPNCYTRPYADDAKDKKPMLCDICGQILDWK